MSAEPIVAKLCKNCRHGSKMSGVLWICSRYLEPTEGVQSNCLDSRAPGGPCGPFAHGFELAEERV